MSNVTESLSRREKIGYGLGDTASNLYFQFFNLFLFYYYTEVFGLSAGAVGTMFFLANFWDAVNDPMMGAIADRVHTRNGKYRPFLLWFALPYGAFGYAIFANPDLAELGKLIYAYITFIGFKMVYTAINVPYSALMGVMTPSAVERMALSTYRFVGAFGGGFLVSLLVRPLVKWFGGDDEVMGFQMTMALFGLFSVLLFWFTYTSTRERVKPQPKKPVKLGEDIRFLLQNKPWIIMVIAAVCTLSSVAVRGAVGVHFFKYYVGGEAQTLFTLGEAQSAFFLEFDRYTVFLSSGMLAFILGVSLTGFVGRLLGKRNALITLTLLNAITIIAFFFIPAEAYATMFWVNILGSFLAGPTPALVWALYTDVADYGEWKFGRRATGLVMSAAMFAQKMGLTMGGAASGWMLELYNYQPNQEQAPEALLSIRILYSLIPGGLALLNGIVVCFLSLNEKTIKQMQSELAELRAVEADSVGEISEPTS
jgi:GPH family glycoside/pentoside/hexuronide:cation symporter